MRTILANKLRRAHARANGINPTGLLHWSQLKESEQDQWLNFAAACVGLGVGLIREDDA